MKNYKQKLCLGFQITFGRTLKFGVNFDFTSGNVSLYREAGKNGACGAGGARTTSTGSTNPCLNSLLTKFNASFVYNLCTVRIKFLVL